MYDVHAAAPTAAASVLPELFCRLPHTRSSVPRARALLRTATDAWAMDRDTAHSAQLVLSELVTNAVRAPGRTPTAVEQQVSVRVVHQDHDETLHLSVGDTSDAHPAPRDPAPGEDESGYGLYLVMALAHRWGTAPRAGGPGKVVWAELCIPAEYPLAALP